MTIRVYVALMWECNHYDYHRKNINLHGKVLGSETHFTGVGASSSSLILSASLLRVCFGDCFDFCFCFRVKYLLSPSLLSVSESDSSCWARKTLKKKCRERQYIFGDKWHTKFGGSVAETVWKDKWWVPGKKGKLRNCPGQEACSMWHCPGQEACGM